MQIHKPKILIVEDEPTNKLVLKLILQKAGYDVVAFDSPLDAIEEDLSQFSVIVTDWMMPRMNGVDFIKQVRKSYHNPPFIVMLTSLDSKDSVETAMASGADCFVTKPLDQASLLDTIQNAIKNKSQEARQSGNSERLSTKTYRQNISFALGVTMSTGGPPTISKLISGLDELHDLTIFIHQQGPEWLIHDLGKRLDEETGRILHIAENGIEIQSGSIYIIPQIADLKISDEGILSITKVENRSLSIDSGSTMLSSLSQAYGKNLIGGVLTGVGSSGSKGLCEVVGVGGTAFAQDPSEAIAPQMPENAIKTCGEKISVATIDQIISLIKYSIHSKVILSS
ncbi:MAG: chemotaxis response regulator protein-glutamate methylesterase [Candidatus Kapaibacteriales bacterium]